MSIPRLLAHRVQMTEFGTNKVGKKGKRAEGGASGALSTVLGTGEMSEPLRALAEDSALQGFLALTVGDNHLTAVHQVRLPLLTSGGTRHT